jgi:hypothetical protein
MKLCWPIMIKNIPSLISSHDSGFLCSSCPSLVQGMRQIVWHWFISPISVRNCFKPCTIFISHARTTKASCLHYTSCATIIWSIFIVNVVSIPNGSNLDSEEGRLVLLCLCSLLVIYDQFGALAGRADVSERRAGASCWCLLPSLLPCTTSLSSS